MTDKTKRETITSELEKFKSGQEFLQGFNSLGNSDLDAEALRKYVSTGLKEDSLYLGMPPLPELTGDVDISKVSLETLVGYAQWRTNASVSFMVNTIRKDKDFGAFKDNKGYAKSLVDIAGNQVLKAFAKPDEKEVELVSLASQLNGYSDLLKKVNEKSPLTAEEEKYARGAYGAVLAQRILKSEENKDSTISYKVRRDFAQVQKALVGELNSPEMRKKGLEIMVKETKSKLDDFAKDKLNGQDYTQVLGAYTARGIQNMVNSKSSKTQMQGIGLAYRGLTGKSMSDEPQIPGYSGGESEEEG